MSVLTKAGNGMEYKKVIVGSLAVLGVALIAMNFHHFSFNQSTSPLGEADNNPTAEQQSPDAPRAPIGPRKEELSPRLALEIGQSNLAASDLIRVYAPEANENPAIGLTLAPKIMPCLDDNSPDGQIRILDMGANVATIEGMIEAERFCAGVSERDLLTLLDLLEISVQQGALHNGRTADVLYFNYGSMIISSPLVVRNLEAASRYRANALSFLNSAAAQGSIESTYWLSVVYEEGRLTARNPAAALATHDAYVSARGRESALDRDRRRMLLKSLRTK